MTKDSEPDPRDVDLAVAAINRSEEDLYFSIGVGYQYLDAPPGVKYKAPYREIGKKLWDALRHELYDLLCDANGKEPHPWVQELVSGDIRNLITGILTARVSTLNVPLAIAIPAAALVMKRGVTEYCDQGKSEPPEKRFQDLLKKKKKKKKNSRGN